MKTKLHTFLLYPLILIFSAFMKGKKKDFKGFFSQEKQPKQKDILKVISNRNRFYENIPLFFNKQSPLYDQTLIEFELDLNLRPEEKKYFNFDFSKVLDIYHTLSMLSARVTNKNIVVSFNFEKQKLDDSQINHLLRYLFLTFASKKVDTLYFDNTLLKDTKSQQAFETMASYLEDATIENFSNAKNLYVLTCKKSKDTFDIIWSSSSTIELTEFNKVYDKYGTLLKSDIQITNSPIYAFHK
ncbi:MAG: hypothetical protein WBG69_07670 [Arcobacteraceae bacterium]